MRGSVSWRQRAWGIALWIGLVGLMGCQEPQLGVIPEEEFELLVTELMVNHSYVFADKELRELKESDSVDLISSIFIEHGVSATDFVQTLEAYLADGEAFDELMDRVIARLQQRAEQYRDSLSCMRVRLVDRGLLWECNQLKRR